MHFDEMTFCRPCRVLEEEEELKTLNEFEMTCARETRAKGIENEKIGG